MYQCHEIKLAPSQMQELISLSPYSSSYTFICVGETIKEVLDIDDIVKGDICYKYITSGNSQITLMLNSTIMDSIHDSPVDFFNKEATWHLIGVCSIVINILLVAMFMIVVTSFHYKRYYSVV